MQAALFALAGVILGAAIPAVVALVTAGRERQRADDDRQDARDARLFEHRREAYADFMTSAQKLIDDGQSARFPGPNPYDHPADTIEPLAAHRARVHLYGTGTAAELASTAMGKALLYAFHDDDLYEAAVEALAAFTTQARQDLGVPG